MNVNQTVKHYFLSTATTSTIDIKHQRAHHVPYNWQTFDRHIAESTHYFSRLHDRAIDREDATWLTLRKSSVIQSKWR